MKELKIGITSQNLNPNIVVSGISTVVASIVNKSNHHHFLYEVGYRDGDKKGLSWLWKQLNFLFDFSKFLKKNGIELLHLNVPFNTLGIIREYIALRIAKRKGIKVMVHIHGGKYLMVNCKQYFVRKLIMGLLQQSQKVLVLSHEEVAALKQNYGFIHAEPMLNAVDVNHYTYNERKLSSSERKLVVLYLARIVESKGIDDIVEGFKKLYQTHPFKFIVCGTGVDQETFLDSCRKIFREGDFEYKGVVVNHEKLEVLQDADVFILPSRHSEGLPMSLLEAMSVGLVPETSNDASMKFVIEDDINGVLVNKYDGNDIYEKMKELFNNPDKIKNLSGNARKSIEQSFNLDMYIKKIDEIYLSICS